MGSFLKSNFVLVLGLCLPLLLIAFISAVRWVQLKDIEPPQYAVLYVSDHYNPRAAYFDIEVENGKLTVTDREAKTEEEQKDKDRIEKDMRFYLFSPQTGTQKSFDYDDIDELQNLTLDDSDLSPDGYIFSRNNRRHNNFFIFGFNHYKSRHALEKEAMKVSIPDPDHYGRVSFIGWIIEEE
jgi:hypothetical protein